MLQALQGAHSPTKSFPQKHHQGANPVLPHTAEEKWGEVISRQDPLASSNLQSWPTPVPRRLKSASPQASICSGERAISSVLLNNRKKTTLMILLSTGHSSWPCTAQRLRGQPGQPGQPRPESPTMCTVPVRNLL